MVTLIIISLILVVLFVGATIYHTHTIPDSVSAMVYSLPHGWRYLWTAWLWAVSMLLLPSLMESLGSYWQCLGFLFAACALFCGAMPLVRNEKNTEHNFSGTASGVFSQACVIVLCPWWLFAWVILLVFVLSDKFRDLTSMWYGKSCLVAEAICYISMVGALLTV